MFTSNNVKQLHINQTIPLEKALATHFVFADGHELEHIEIELPFLHITKRTHKFYGEDARKAALCFVSVEQLYYSKG